MIWRNGKQWNLPGQGIESIDLNSLITRRGPIIVVARAAEFDEHAQKVMQDVTK